MIQASEIINQIYEEALANKHLLQYLHTINRVIYKWVSSKTVAVAFKWANNLV